MEIETLRVDGRAKEGKVGEGEGFLVSLPTPYHTPFELPHFLLLFGVQHSTLLCAKHLRVQRKCLHCRLKLEKKEAFFMKR